MHGIVRLRIHTELLCCLQVLAMVSNAHYLHRMTILGALAALAPAVAHDTLCNTMLPVLLSCAADKVPEASLLLS